MWFLRRLLKLDSPITVGEWLYDRITNNWLWIISILGASLMGYLAAISDWIKPWGPIGWGIAGIASASFLAVVFSLASFLFAAAYHRRQSTSYIKSSSKSVKSINPLKDNFEQEKIIVSDFFTPFDNLYSKKTFRKCHFYGPGTILFVGNCNLDSSRIFRSDFILINKGSSFSGIGFLDCSFFECKFFGVTMIVNQTVATAIYQDCVRSGAQPPEFLGANFSLTEM